MHRRRIDDILEDAFQHACLTGDLDIAADLVGLLERKYARWIARHGTDRRTGDPRLIRLRDELDKRRRIRLAETRGKPG